MISNVSPAMAYWTVRSPEGRNTGITSGTRPAEENELEISVSEAFKDWEKAD